ncbi:MAG: metallophosphoesterase family protein [Planctomycetes bacterium]|nr:metallophosphoesterase family protein [Planctomycetota bacterium]
MGISAGVDQPRVHNARISPQRLRFGAQGHFTIVQFTDLHWRNGDAADQRTRELMNHVFDAERPDLVVLTGDVIEGAECTDPAQAWREVVWPMEERAAPWAAVFGNHDDEGSLGREQLLAVQQSCRMCLSEPGPEEVPGVGNYVLAIQSARDSSIAAVIYFLDSGGVAPAGVDGYAWITAEQIQWYRGESRGRFERIPALAFFHIPLPEFDEVWNPQTCVGSKHEEVCCPQINSGFLSALREQGDVKGVFVGHDHLNDFEGTLDGIRLCYGRATGYGSYGRDDFPRGARVIRLREGERAFTTWLSLDRAAGR